MKLSYLRYLVAFANSGSISRAADYCNISQPTLSVALQNLESELGVVLLERTKGRATLTELGKKVATQARRTLDEAHRVELVAEQGKDPLQGVFKLGVIHTIGPYLLPGLVSALKQIAPGLKLYVEESMTALLIDYLKYDTVDAAIIALPFELPGVVTQPLYDEYFRVVVPKGHSWQKRHSIPSADVGAEDVLVLKAGNCFRDQVLDACPDISHAESALYQGHSIETIRCMVASGYGISVLPESAIGHPYRSDSIVDIPFEEPAPFRRVALAWRDGHCQQPVIDAISNAVHGMGNPACRAIRH